MAERRKFEIAFVGLKQGVHEFTYDLDTDFFLEKESTEFEKVNASVKLSLEKLTGFMQLKFEIGGKAEVVCDRCGNPLKLDLWDEFMMIIKLVDNPDEMNNNEEDPDIFYIPRTASHLNVESWVYEFVLLSLPMQKICGKDEEGNSLCNPEVIKKLTAMQLKNNENNANSLWKGLDKFKEN